MSGDSVQQRLDSLFQKFNVDRPADFHGQSMSTSDVVVVMENGSRTAYYVDTVSFVEMPDFFREKNYQLLLNDSDHTIQFGQTFVSLEAAQDAGNEAIWSGKAIGYAVLNRQEQKVEVYDSVFPASGVFSEEVYANSPFQTLTVHTDAPMTPEPPKKHRPTRAEQLYNLFAEMYPEIVSGEHTYERYHEKDGKIYYRQGEHMDEVRGNTAELTRMQKLIKIRTLTRLLLDKQKTNVPDEALTAMREKLNALYDAYVKENGALSSADNKKRFGRDADYPILQSLENYNAQTQTYEKADIFFRRTVSPVQEIKAVETLDEAYQVSLDRRGKPDIPYMAALLQNTEPDMEPKQLMENIQRDLLASGLVFLDPEKQIADVPFSGITDRSEYLSGNVRRKLAFAEERAKQNPVYQANIDAMKAVIPETIHAEEITVRMGCSWIDAEDYTKFLHTLSGRDSWDIRCEVTYIPQTGEFDIMKAGSRKDLNVNEGTTYGTDSLTMYEIALKMLNQTRIVVNKTVPSPKDPSKTVTRVDPEKTRLAQEKAKQIEAKFKEWIFADPTRKEKYEKRYNELFNALVGRRYDGSRLTFNGMATDFELRPHQRDCIARAVYGGNTLAAHVVGAGKSAVFITSVMKKKELGLINKACIVVPKALTEQTALEWRRIFPDARLLTVGEMDLSTQDKRDVFTARIATGNYDAVIVSREQFDKMAMFPAYQREYIQREIDALEDMLIAQKMAGATKNTPSVKKIEAAKKRLEKRLENALNPKKMSTRSKDGVLEFEQLGFDYLVVDEAHAYKNGFVATRMTDVAGVTTTPSGRAQDMQMKCDWMNEQLGQGHILYCTGTPNASPYQH